eukprot:8727122-Alexandrium_andersonii.AAC.1
MPKEEAEGEAKAMEEGWAKDEWQHTPLEFAPMHAKYRQVAVESVLVTVLRKAGASVLTGRAPRGNAIRALTA